MEKSIVTKIRKVSETPDIVYNLNVADNHNYYIGIPRGKGKGKVDLLLGVSDDDDTTEWYVVDGLDGCKLIGYSLISQGDSMNIYLNL
jgi:hypothetical protein